MDGASALRIGVDLGGTKIAGIALGPRDEIRDEFRMDTPREDYQATINAIVTIVELLERDEDHKGTVGIGIPGSCSPVSGLIQNANSTWLNARPFKADLEAALDRPLRMANDANCFALSEATDGSAAGARSIFGVILGTGCGGGIVINGQLVDGPLGISGEWGHTPLPSPGTDELPGQVCWCGRANCMETWVSGPAVAADHARLTGTHISAEAIAALAREEDSEARAALDRLADRLARGLATVVNIIDPEVIVLGGGLSSIETLYPAVSDRIAPHIFADHVAIDIRPPRWGPASGVRGAARLWP